MNILLLGSGGREHALAWKLKQSKLCENLFVAPGNAGTSEYGWNVALDINDFEAVAHYCISNQMDMVVVGPEEPLVNGIYDFLKASPQLKNLIVVGPSADAAQLEGSKAFSKQFMQRHDIPTAGYAEFTKETYEAGKEYISKQPLPVVLKADGLAAGKGVVIATTHEEALQAFESMIVNKQFGAASAKVVIEEFLQGIELSLFVLTDGKDYKIIGHAKDYKRIGEGDTGLNTGGMGAISPVPFADAAFLKKVEEQIVIPTIEGLKTDGIKYKGFIFVGIMNCKGNPFVIEYNCRMGDPETEVVVPRVQSDLLDLFIAVGKSKLKEKKLQIDPRIAATVMLVAGGYPEEYEKGKEIKGFEKCAGSLLFHAGTTENNGKIFSNGGRILAITSFGNSIQEAVSQSFANAEKITYEGKYYRKDIGSDLL